MWNKLPVWVRWALKLLIVIVGCVLLRVDINLNVGVLKLNTNVGYKGISFTQDLVHIEENK